MGASGCPGTWDYPGLPNRTRGFPGLTMMDGVRPGALGHDVNVWDAAGSVVEFGWVLLSDLDQQ